MRRVMMVLAAALAFGLASMTAPAHAQAPASAPSAGGYAVVQGDTEAVNVASGYVYLTSNHDFAEAYSVQSSTSGTRATVHASGGYYVSWDATGYTYAPLVDIEVDLDSAAQTVRFVVTDVGTGAVLRDSGTFALQWGGVNIP